MAAMEPLFGLVRVDTIHLSKEQLKYLDYEFFALICFYLKKYLQPVMPVDIPSDWIMEIIRMENDNVIRLAIKELVINEDYTISGIALSLREPEEIIYEIASGQNFNPSLEVSKKIIDLHKASRPALYKSIVEEIIAEFCKSL